MAQQVGRSDLAPTLLHLATLFFLFVSYASAQFFQPAGEGEVWHVGERKTIRYSTTLTNYSIALWQQSIDEPETATLGPILVRVPDGPQTEFTWEVQLYNFNYTKSNVFYFWLKPGAGSDQGDFSTNDISISTPYFNITKEPAPHTTTNPSSSRPPSAVVSSQTPFSSLPPPVTVSTSTPADDNAGSSSAKDSKGSSSSSSNSPPPAGGLPVAAKASIGVGAATVGVTCIACAVVWYRHLKKTRQILERQQQQKRNTRPPSPPNMRDMEGAWKAQELCPGFVTAYTYPCELSTSRDLAEMDTNHNLAEMDAPGLGRPAIPGHP
ncbi:hypothetical protein VTI28DRAFT_8106 [Corynascus sepedonium]